jgi:(1->4)-alpha-D-glucan 1-alpha-D-glucosylmutase
MSYQPPTLTHPAAPSRAPVSSYRLQLNQAFTFQDAIAQIDYLAALGITECYASPVLTASPGSAHGYDICNHNQISPELGGREGFDALVAALAQLGLGLVLDFVPNHMGIDPRTNEWWRDVLENGPSSPYAEFFDIDWAPVKPELLNKVLLPILGDQYGLVLERGELQLRFVEGSLELTYFDRALPINPRQAPRVYRVGIEDLRAELGDGDADLRELLSILTALWNLPPYTERDPERIVERQREKEVSRERLARLVERSPRIRAHIAHSVQVVNGTPGDRGSFDRLHELLEVQAYRLAYWRTAFDEINYRRFFDINDLAALRMEDPRVFAATHGLLLDLIRRGAVTGVRIDHPDGLFDPAGYFAALQRAASEPPRRDAPAPDGTPARRLYLVAEKILSPGEALPAGWAVHGTTGYNFLTTLNGLFVKHETLPDLLRIYRRFTGERVNADDAVYVSKRSIMRNSLASELNVLAHALNRISEADRRTRDFTLNTLRRALTEVVACFPVYRTYVTTAGTGSDDERIIDEAIAGARRRDPVLESSIFAFIRRNLVPRAAAGGASIHEMRAQFAMKLQQFTGPVQAKGLEDTAFYRLVPLVSTNEVGGDPNHRAWSDTEFHAANQARLRDWPFEMTTTATHDTKRGEDTRMRINVLSELPTLWRRAVTRWTALNEDCRSRVNGEPAPDRNDEWLFYQSLVGAWPAEPPDHDIPERAAPALVDRLAEYMLKAVKEAKRHTSWAAANADYDDAVDRFVRETLTGTSAPEFLAAFVPFQRIVAWFGMINSLAQVVIRLTAPGMPDVYQGTELWDLSLVDPDNRRPVDFARRRALLASLEPLLATVADARRLRAETIDERTRSLLGELLHAWWDGRIKLHVMTVALRVRRALPELFLLGDYLPLEADTPNSHLFGFVRRRGDDAVIAVAPRFLWTRLRGEPRAPLGAAVWQAARLSLPPELAHRTYANALTGELVRPLVHRGAAWLMASDVFSTWPVALLVSCPDAPP